MSKTEAGFGPSCEDQVDPAFLSVEAARSLILGAIRPVAESEMIRLRDSLDRVLAEEVRSAMNVPPHTNSAVDGYALRSDDLIRKRRRFTLIGAALAGKPYLGSVGAGQCVRITTGAPMPGGADTVVMQERSALNGRTLRIGTGDRPGQNVRQAGEDIETGEIVLAAGERLMPAQMGLLGSLGIGELRVKRRPRVAFFSTGDEVRSLGESLDNGMLYDSNRYTLLGMLGRLGVEKLDLGVIEDDPAALRGAFARAAEDSDVVITSGGVSVGEADYIKQVLNRLGAIQFWQVAMKPGRPLAFGRIGSSTHRGVFIGLPGNPVAVMVCFYQFIQPALRRLAGERNSEPLVLTARCESRLRKRPGRTEFQRGRLSRQAGELIVRKTGKQGSGILSSMAQADCFIVLPTECGEVEPGMPVAVQPFFGLI